MDAVIAAIGVACPGAQARDDAVGESPAAVADDVVALLADGAVLLCGDTDLSLTARFDRRDDDSVHALSVDASDPLRNRAEPPRDGLQDERVCASEGHIASCSWRRPATS